MQDSETPMKESGRPVLDAPPPVVKTKGNLLSTVKGPGATPPNPQMMALAGFAQMKQGAKMMGIALPDQAAPLMQMMQALEAAMPRILSSSFSPGGIGAANTPPPPPAAPPGVALPPQGGPAGPE